MERGKRAREFVMNRRIRRIYGGFIFDEERSFRRAMGLIHQIDSASQNELEYDIALDCQDRLLILLYGKSVSRYLEFKLQHDRVVFAYASAEELAALSYEIKVTRPKFRRTYFQYPPR